MCRVKWTALSRPFLAFNLLMSGGSILCMGRRRHCPVIQTLVQTLIVVKAEVAVNARPRFHHRCVVFQVHLLIFERPL